MAAYLRRVKNDFVRDCIDKFKGISEYLVAQECGRGIPGRDRLRALAAGKTSRSGGEPGREAGLKSADAAGLEKLKAAGWDAGRLERLYTGAVSGPGSVIGLPSQTRAVAAPKPLTAPRVELNSIVKIDSRLSKDEQAFAQALLDRMQDCAEGRAILSGLVREGQAGNISFHITFQDYPGTQIVRKGDLEDIQGGCYGASDSWTHALYINRAMTKFRTRELAVDSTVGTAAHEMTHLWRAARVQRTMPQYVLVRHFDLGDEFAARLKGDIVAAQTHRGAATNDTEEARDILADPDDYRERMKLADQVYASSLDLGEMADPVAAYQPRLQALQNYLQDLKTGQQEEPVVLKRIAHFCKAHGLCEPLRELKALTETGIKTYPYDIDAVKKAIQQVQNRIAYSKSDEGKKFAVLLKRAAADPKYRSLEQENREDLARLRREVALRPLPVPKKTPGQIGREGFDALVDKDRKVNPGHAKELD